MNHLFEQSDIGKIVARKLAHIGAPSDIIEFFADLELDMLSRHRPFLTVAQWANGLIDEKSVKYNSRKDILCIDEIPWTLQSLNELVNSPDNSIVLIATYDDHREP